MKKKNFLPAWLYIWLTALYCELMIYVWNAEGSTLGRFLTVLFFAIGEGALLAFVVSLLRPKAAKITAVVLAAVMSVFTLAEHFLRDAYQVFMSISTIISGAGGVAEDYFGLIMKLLLRDIWRILLMLIPVGLYAWRGKPGQAGKLMKKNLAITAAGMYLLGMSFVVGVNGDPSVLTGDFDTAVRSCGLHISLIADFFPDSTGDLDFEELPQQGGEKDPQKNPEKDPENQEGTQGTGSTEGTTEPPKVYGPQVLNIDFEKLASTETKEAIASLHKYVASQTPAKENEYTGLFKGKNLIFITAEAFSAEVIDPQLTPTLYRLATKGIQFKDYYQPAWGGSTSTGEFTNITGLVPANGIDSIKEGTQQNMFLLMGKQLQKAGYFSAAYHNHSYDYYSRHKTHTALGYDEFIGYGNGMEAGVKKQWPESDLELMDYSVGLYVDKQPFSIYYMTVSGHCLYSVGGNNMSRKNIDKVAHLDASDTVKAYMAANLELEYGMASLVRQLEEAGIADDTVIVLATDHYPYGLEKSSTWNNTEDYLSELYGKEVTDCFIRDHSALIIWSGCIEDQNIVVEEPVFSLDILPTLSNLFDVEYDSRLMVGRDVFSEAEPIIFWADRSWITDKGSYNVSNKTFTPKAGVTVDEEYVSRINSIVKNKINFSKSVQKEDYFDYVYPYFR